MPGKLPLLAVLLLAGFLLTAGTAHAAQAGPTAVPLAFEEEFEGEEGEEEVEGYEELEDEEEGELEDETCGEAEVEFELGEIDEAEAEAICREAEEVEAKRAAGVAPPECLLRSADARAVADPERGKLKLTVGYTTYEPVDAAVEVRAGSTRIAAIHRHLGRSGVLRLVKSVGKDPAPKRLVVQIRIPGSPPFCGKFQTQKIPVSGVGGDAAPRHARHSKGD